MRRELLRRNKMGFFSHIHARIALMRWGGSKTLGKHKRIRIKRSYEYHDQVMITCKWSLREVKPDGTTSDVYYGDEDRVSVYYIQKHIKDLECNVLPKMIKRFADKIGEEL